MSTTITPVKKQYTLSFFVKVTYHEKVYKNWWHRLLNRYTLVERTNWVRPSIPMQMTEAKWNDIELIGKPGEDLYAPQLEQDYTPTTYIQTSGNVLFVEPSATNLINNNGQSRPPEPTHGS